MDMNKKTKELKELSERIGELAKHREFYMGRLERVNSFLEHFLTLKDDDKRVTISVADDDILSVIDEKTIRQTMGVVRASLRRRVTQLNKKLAAIKVKK